jgi:hypothetical protein
VTEGGDGYVCIVCGAPRILVEGKLARAGGEKSALLASKKARLRQAAWGAAGGVAALVGAFSAIVTSLLALFIDYGPVSLAFAVTSALVPFGFSFFAFRRSRRSANAAREALEQAHVTVAQEVLRASGPAADANELARRLRVSIPRAEELLALAQVERFLTEPMPEFSEQRVRVEADDLTQGDGDNNALLSRKRL